MFCLNCGKELPDGAKFCAFCGTVISIEPQQTQEQKPSEVSAPSQSSENTSQDSNIAEGKVQQQKSAILQKKKSIVIIGVAIALVVAVVVGIFSIRANNEHDMIRQIPWMVYNDETSNKIRAYYEDYLGKDIMVGCDAEDFSVEQGSDSNSFDFVGKIEVTDLSQDSRPTYFVNVTGTVTTNFFRTKFSLTYQLAYEEPEVTSEYDDVAGIYITVPEYGYEYFMSIGYEDSSKQTAYLEIEWFKQSVLVELNERHGNTIYGTDLSFYPQATSPSQAVELDYNPHDGSITATVYTYYDSDVWAIPFIPYKNAPFSNPFYVD